MATRYPRNAARSSPLPQRPTPSKRPPGFGNDNLPRAANDMRPGKPPRTVPPSAARRAMFGRALGWAGAAYGAWVDLQFLWNNAGSPLMDYFSIIPEVLEGYGDGYNHYCGPTSGGTAWAAATLDRCEGMEGRSQAVNCGGTNHSTNKCNQVVTPDSLNGTSWSYIVKSHWGRYPNTTTWRWWREEVWKRKSGGAPALYTAPRPQYAAPPATNIPPEPNPWPNLIPGHGTPLDPFHMPDTVPYRFRPATRPDYPPTPRWRGRPRSRPVPRPRPEWRPLPSAPGEPAVWESPAPEPGAGPTYSFDVPPAAADAPGANSRPSAPPSGSGRHQWRPPRKGEREQKQRNKFAAAAQASWGSFTEFNDFTNSFWKALPYRFKTRQKGTKTSFFQKWRDMAKAAREMSPGEWATFWSRGGQNWAAETASDFAYGVGGRFNKWASQHSRPHGDLPFGYQFGGRFHERRSDQWREEERPQ